MSAPILRCVPLLLALSTVSRAGGDDAAPRAVFPSPRHSGTGSIPFEASNVHLLGWKSLYELNSASLSASDCWGYTSPSGREYALIGLSNGTGIVEVTDPGAPVVVAFLSGPSSHWRGLKTHGTFAYAVSEGGGGIQVFDLSNLDSGVATHTASVLTGGSTTATHTLAVDNTSGFLYRSGGGSSEGLRIYSLANPALPTFVGEWQTRYVHEVQVLTWDVPGPHLGKQIAFCFTNAGSSGGTPRLQILDVTNKSSIQVMASIGYTGSSFSHQGWVTPDRTRLYLNDELDDASFGGARTRVFGLADLTAPVYLGSFAPGLVAPSTDHNLYIKDNRIYAANYRSGLRLYDLTATPTEPVASGYFDTYPEDDGRQTDSLWSNYPFFASGTVIGSDEEKGLWIWRTGTAALTFDFPTGRPELLGPAGGVVQFLVEESTPGDLQPGTVQFHYSTGGPFVTVSATALGGDLYEARLPPAPCGSSLQYYVSAKAHDDATWTDPPAAPTQVHQTVAAFGETVHFTDDFELDTGWQVDLPADLAGLTQATTGTWIRADPIGSAQPEDDHSAAPGASCFVTANGSVGGPWGDADVDGGTTSLRSPALDASGLSDPHVTYWRWFSNGPTISQSRDTLKVQISSDGGLTWVPLETVGPDGPDVLGGWIRHTARIADFVPPTSDVRLRFLVADLGTGSTVEAALDDLQLVDFDCTPPSVWVSAVTPATGSLEGGEVVTLSGYGFGPSTTVHFGANPASSVVFLDSSTLEVRVPAASRTRSGKAGQLSEETVDVVVANPGSSTLSKAYTYRLRQKSR